jgi:hypothetical protein
LQQTVQQLGGEKDGEIQQLQERVETLQQHIENICQQHEEVLLRAENDKQQALLLGKLTDLHAMCCDKSYTGMGSFIWHPDASNALKTGCVPE